MLKQDSTQTLTQSQSELLERRKTAILNLIQEMSQSLPPMVQLMIKQYHTTVAQSLDKLTFEQTEELIEKAQEIIDDIRG